MREPDFEILGGPTEVTVDSTATGKTLATLLGAALAAGIRRITLIVGDAGIYWATGSATAGACPLPVGTNQIDGNAVQLAALKFVTAAGTVKMTVLQEG